MLFIRAFLFTIIVPGFILGWMPAWLAGNWPQRFALDGVRLLGLLPGLSGIFIYLLTTLSFIVKGQGTPAIWFTRPLRFLLGEEPGRLVGTGLYSHSRNPMYLGVLLIALGEAIFFQFKVLFIYLILLAMFFHLVVIWVEEPHLARKYGQTYREYCNGTPRWWGSKR